MQILKTDYGVKQLINNSQEFQSPKVHAWFIKKHGYYAVRLLSNYGIEFLRVNGKWYGMEWDNKRLTKKHKHWRNMVKPKGGFTPLNRLDMHYLANEGLDALTLKRLQGRGMRR